MPLDNLRRSLPDDAADRVLLALDCANESRLGPDPEVLASAPLVVNVDHHHDNSRFGGVNLVVADASSTGEIVRDLLRELDVELTPGHGRGALHRARHRHRPLPVHEHDAEGAPARRRARRGGRRRAQGLPGRLRERPVREAEAARPGAGASADLRGRPARDLVPAARRLRRGGGGRAVLGGDHRLPARGRRRGHGRAHPRAPARRRPRPAGEPARIGGRARRVEIARASGDGGGHRQAAGFSSSDSIEEITEFIRREFVEAVRAS